MNIHRKHFPALAMTAAATVLVVLTVPHAMADDASFGNSTRVFDCDSIIATVSRGDYLDCETNHNNHTDCFDWAHERKAILNYGVGATCELTVATLKGSGGCEDQGKTLRISYHVHRGLECTLDRGCTGVDGAPQPHDHWEDVDLDVDCY